MARGRRERGPRREVPLYAARIEDLAPGDLVRVECAACGHDVLITRSALLQGLRLQPADLVLDLLVALPLPRMRCAREGGRVGEVGRSHLIESPD